jgi:hypothetical protein
MNVAFPAAKPPIMIIVSSIKSIHQRRNMYQVNHIIVTFVTFLFFVMPMTDAAKKIGKSLVISPIDNIAHSASPMMKPQESPRSKAPVPSMLVGKEKLSPKPNFKVSVTPVKLTGSPTLLLPTTKPTRMMNTLKPTRKPTPISMQSFRPAILSVPNQPIKVNKLSPLNISPINVPKIPKIPEVPKIP